MAGETVKAKVAEAAKTAKTAVGGVSDESKLFGALAYLITPFTGILVYFMKKEDSFVKFHGVQSILFGVVAYILSFGLGIVTSVLTFATMGVGGICVLILPLFWLAVFVLWVFLMWKAYSGERYKLPYLGEMSEKYAR